MVKIAMFGLWEAKHGKGCQKKGWKCRKWRVGGQKAPNPSTTFSLSCHCHCPCGPFHFPAAALFLPAFFPHIKSHSLTHEYNLHKHQKESTSTRNPRPNYISETQRKIKFTDHWSIGFWWPSLSYGGAHPSVISLVLFGCGLDSSLPASCL